MAGPYQQKKSKSFVNNCNFDEMPSLKKNSTTKNGKNNKSKNAKNPTTKIVIKCNCGFPNNLFIRGEGIQGLSWDRGMQLKNTKPDEWVWETDQQFKKGKVKIILNDRVYEQGDNHAIECGKLISFEPHF